KDARSAIIRLLDGGRDVELFQKHAVLCSGRVQNVKTMIAKPRDGFVIGWWIVFLCHVLLLRLLNASFRCQKFFEALISYRVDTLAQSGKSVQCYCCAKGNWLLPGGGELTKRGDDFTC